MLSSPGAGDFLDFFSVHHITSTDIGLVPNAGSPLLTSMTSLTQCGRYLPVPFAGLTKESEKYAKASLGENEGLTLDWLPSVTDLAKDQQFFQKALSCLMAERSNFHILSASATLLCVRTIWR